MPPAEQADTAQAVASAAALGIPVCRMAPYAVGSCHLELLLEDVLPKPRGSGLARSLSRRGSAPAPPVRYLPELHGSLGGVPFPDS